MCYLKNCVANENTDKDSIMLCSGQEKKHFILCGKNAGMKCDNKSECYSNKSYRGYCKKKGSAYKYLRLAILAIILSVLLVINVAVYAFKKYVKNKNITKE